MAVVEARREVDRPDPARRLVPEEGPVLDLKAGLAHLLGDAQPLKNRKTERQKRLADVKARELLLLEEQDLPSRAREGGRDGRPAGAASDDDRVPGLRHPIDSLIT